MLVQPDGKIVAAGWGSTVPIDLIIGRRQDGRRGEQTRERRRQRE